MQGVRWKEQLSLESSDDFEKKFNHRCSYLLLKFFKKKSGDKKEVSQFKVQVKTSKIFKSYLNCPTSLNCPTTLNCPKCLLKLS